MPPLKSICARILLAAHNGFAGSEHVHCDAILLVRIAWCLLSSSNAGAFSRLPGSASLVSRLMPSCPLCARCFSLNVVKTAAVVVHVVSTRKCVWTRNLPPISVDNHHRHLHHINAAMWTSQKRSTSCEAVISWRRLEV